MRLAGVGLTFVPIMLAHSALKTIHAEAGIVSNPVQTSPAGVGVDQIRIENN